MTLSIVLLLAPALLLLTPLLAGRYPGEELLDRARAPVPAPTPRAPRALAAPARRRPRACVGRGGRLVSLALAGRAPPGGSAVFR